MRKHYKNIVTVENETQALLLGAKEGSEYTGIYMQQQRPMRIVIQKPRSYLKALWYSICYSKIGLFNLYLECDKMSE